MIVIKRKITTKIGGDFPFMVDPKGIEPSTSRMRTVRSPMVFGFCPRDNPRAYDWKDLSPA